MPSHHECRSPSPVRWMCVALQGRRRSTCPAVRTSAGSSLIGPRRDVSLKPIRRARPGRAGPRGHHPTHEGCRSTNSRHRLWSGLGPLPARKVGVGLCRGEGVVPLGVVVHPAADTAGVAAVQTGDASAALTALRLGDLRGDNSLRSGQRFEVRLPVAHDRRLPPRGSVRPRTAIRTAGCTPTVRQPLDRSCATVSALHVCPSTPVYAPARESRRRAVARRRGTRPLTYRLRWAIAAVGRADGGLRRTHRAGAAGTQGARTLARHPAGATLTAGRRPSSQLSGSTNRRSGCLGDKGLRLDSYASPVRAGRVGRGGGNRSRYRMPLTPDS